MKKNEPLRIFAISVDTPEASRELVRKIESDGKGPVRFRLLSDPASRAIDAYGLRDPAYQGKSVYGIPRPAVFIIDGNGVVRWSRIESDYRVRPSNSEIRSALEALE